jgi:hypothetical protein
MTGHMKDVHTAINGSVAMLSPIISALITNPGYPSFKVELQKPEIPTITINLPMPNQQLNETYPQFNWTSSTPAAAEGEAAPAEQVSASRTFNLKSMSLKDSADLQAILKAFKKSNATIIGK